MASSRRFGALAFAIQPFGGPAATAPLFRVPIISGGMGPQKDWDDLPRIGVNLSRLGRYPQRARGGGTITILAHPEALGMLLYMVCGSQSNSGTNPTQHTYTITDEYPAGLSMTFWTNIGIDGLLGSTFMFADTFIGKMTMRGTSGNNLEIEMDVTSFDYRAETTVPALSGTGSSDENDEPRYKYIGSSIKLSPNLYPPTDEYSAESVMFEIDRAPDYRYGPSLTPQLIVPDRLVNFDAGWTFDSTVGGWDFLLEEYQGSLTGISGGPDQSTPRGSFDVTFGRHPNDVTRLMRILSNGRNWEYDIARPDAEAQPGVLELEAAGIVAAPNTEFDGTGTSEVTITLNNDFAGDYS